MSEVAVLGARVGNIEQEIHTIKTNHLEHMEKDLADASKDLAIVSNDVDWLKRFFWVLVTSAVGAFVASTITVIMQFKQHI